MLGVVCGLLTEVSPCVFEQSLECLGFSSCSSQALEHRLSRGAGA